MGSPSDLLRLVLSRPATLGPKDGARGRLLCLDGPAGSGKTTLAEALSTLAVEMGISTTVVHLDDLYDGWSGLPRLSGQLDPLLLPLSHGETGSYRRYDWAAGQLVERVSVVPSSLLILEGVGSGISAYRPLRTLLVWVDAPAETRLARWLTRDGADAEPFIAAWQRDEEALFAQERTREAADVVWSSGS